MRTKRVRAALFGCFAAGGDRFGFRLVEYSIQSNHLHMIVEADDATCLARGMQGLKVRIARALNRTWNLRGRRFTDRFHSRVLRTLREVRNVLSYVLHNARRHGCRLAGIDPFSSGPAFDGWTTSPIPTQDLLIPRAHPRSWKLRVGWRKLGLIFPTATPGQ